MILISIFIITGMAGLMAQENSSQEWRYDIECAGIGAGTEGTYLVRVWTYSKNPKKVTTNQMKKNAVHGVLFKGFSGETGCTSQKPIIRSVSVYYEKSDFFNLFFSDEGGYLKYANIVSSSLEIIKLQKKEFKVGAIFSISKDLLRKDLESAGVIRGLSSGF
jgi:hypothetical protein